MVNCGQTVAITEALKLGILNFQTKQFETFKLFHVAKAEKLDVTMIFCAFHNFWPTNPPLSLVQTNIQLTVSGIFC